MRHLHAAWKATWYQPGQLRPMAAGAHSQQRKCLVAVGPMPAERLRRGRACRAWCLSQRRAWAAAAPPLHRRTWWGPRWRRGCGPLATTGWSSAATAPCGTCTTTWWGECRAGAVHGAGRLSGWWSGWAQRFRWVQLAAVSVCLHLRNIPMCYSPFVPHSLQPYSSARRGSGWRRHCARPLPAASLGGHWRRHRLALALSTRQFHQGVGGRGEWPLPPPCVCCCCCKVTAEQQDAR